MRPCAARDCVATLSEPVWTRKQGRLDVCKAHRKMLADAGEIADGPPTAFGLVLDPEAAHRRKIIEGLAEARERGVHVGRPRVPVPPAAVEAVRAGVPIKTVAREYGVERNTLRRRVSDTDPVEVPTVEPAEHSALGAVVEAIRRAHGRRASAQSKRDAAARDVAAADAELHRLSTELAKLTGSAP